MFKGIDEPTTTRALVEDASLRVLVLPLRLRRDDVRHDDGRHAARRFRIGGASNAFSIAPDRMRRRMLRGWGMVFWIVYVDVGGITVSPLTPVDRC